MPNTSDKNPANASGKTKGENHGAAQLAELLKDRHGSLPVWIRAPRNGGPCRYSGFSRAKLYALANEGKIRSVSIREPGQIKGVRLWNLASILEFIARCEASANAEEEAERTAATLPAPPRSVGSAAH